MTDTAKKTWPAMSIAEATAQLTAPGARLEMDTVTIRGIPTRVWKNCPPTNREVFLAGRMFGEREFLIYKDDRCTYESFARATLKLAAQLQRDGVEKGDRVAIIMRNLPEWVVAFYAAELVGAIVTPLNAWWTGPELEYGLVDSGSNVAFVDSERLERIANVVVRQQVEVDALVLREHRQGRGFSASRSVAAEEVAVGPLADAVARLGN